MGGSKPGKHYSSKSLEAYGLSDKGSVRSNNEDYFGYYIPADIGVKEKGAACSSFRTGSVEALPEKPPVRRRLMFCSRNTISTGIPRKCRRG